MLTEQEKSLIDRQRMSLRFLIIMSNQFWTVIINVLGWISDRDCNCVVSF